MFVLLERVCYASAVRILLQLINIDHVLLRRFDVLTAVTATEVLALLTTTFTPQQHHSAVSSQKNVTMNVFCERFLFFFVALFPTSYKPLSRNFSIRFVYVSLLVNELQKSPILPLFRLIKKAPPFCSPRGYHKSETNLFISEE